MAVSARGFANQSLYLARILSAAWQRDLDAELVPASTLEQAYFPAVLAHLRSAYGWFLLDIVRQEPLPAEPPHSVATLPPRPPGKVLPGEIREFERLENEGWLGDMLAPPRSASPQAQRDSDNLAMPLSTATGLEQAATWARALQGLFDRMGDSLDEY